MKLKQKWQHLLAQLEAIAVDEWQEIWNEDEFLTFESETGIVFPADYQKFCRVFGAGMLGEYMRIESPNIKSQLRMLNLKEEFNNFTTNNSHNYNVNSINNLLSHGFVIAFFTLLLSVLTDKHLLAEVKILLSNFGEFHRLLILSDGE